jgi:hypothetical protein
MKEIELKKLQDDVREELKSILTQKDEPSYLFGPDFSKIKAKANELIENEYVKQILCSEKFRNAYDIAELIIKAYDIYGLAELFTGAETVTGLTTKAIAMAASIVFEKIDLDDYCK